MSTAATTKRASFLNADKSEGGGGLWASDGPVAARLIKGVFNQTPPSDSYVADGNPIFAHATFLIDGDGPEADRTVTDSWSLGAKAGDNYEVGPDGDYLVPKIEDAHIVKDCKFGTLTNSLENEGVSKEILGAFGWSDLVGLYGQWKRIVDKERTFSNQNQKKSKFPPSTLCLVKLLAAPGQKGATTTAATTAPVANNSTAPASSAPADVDSAAWGYLENVLKANSNTLDRGKVTLAVSKAAMKDANRQAIARRAAEESFINDLAGMGLVTYDDKGKGQPVTLVTA